MKAFDNFAVLVLKFFFLVLNVTTKFEMNVDTKLIGNRYS
jgi:hypothetical protein